MNKRIFNKKLKDTIEKLIRRETHLFSNKQKYQENENTFYANVFRKVINESDYIKVMQLRDSANKVGSRIKERTGTSGPGSSTSKSGTSDGDDSSGPEREKEYGRNYGSKANENGNETDTRR